MIFSELYGAYYNAVAGVLKEAVKQPLEMNEIRRIVEEHAFGESVLSIEPALAEGRWPLLKGDGSANFTHVPDMPLTTLQKRWLKAISMDPRIRLFTDEPIMPDEIEPLFEPEDYLIYDKYSDGDPFEDEHYIEVFRQICDSIKNRQPLLVRFLTRKRNRATKVLVPEYLEYSEKDDKFRLVGSGCRHGGVINLGRILSFEPYEGPIDEEARMPGPKPKSVVFELCDERKALERVLLHFAHYEKQAERIEGEPNRYLITLSYDEEDETEVLIRILSFGPMVRVREPQRFVDLIKERLVNQMGCGL